ncbi:MAG: WD40/YVTN/BNR-like repeat-containing protein [Gallionellaceae bacterium]
MRFEVAGSADMIRIGNRLLYLVLLVYMVCNSAWAELISTPAASGEKLTMAEMTVSAGQVLASYTQPQVPKKMWAGTMHGGLWLSVDAGNSWAPASSLMNNLAVASIAAQEGNPDIIYVGTGYAHKSDAASDGQGMFKS